MRRLAALVSVLVLLTLPLVVQAQGTIPDGTVGVFVFQVIDGEPVQQGEPLVVIPLQQACLPGNAS